MPTSEQHIRRTTPRRCTGRQPHYRAVSAGELLRRLAAKCIMEVRLARESDLPALALIESAAVALFPTADLPVEVAPKTGAT